MSNKKDYEEIRQKLQNFTCDTCSVNVGEAAASAPPPTFEYIGVISTQFPEKRGTPRQPGICSSTIAKVTLNNRVFTNPEHAVEGLQEYSHMWLVQTFFIFFMSAITIVTLYFIMLVDMLKVSKVELSK